MSASELIAMGKALLKAAENATQTPAQHSHFLSSVKSEAPGSGSHSVTPDNSESLLRKTMEIFLANGSQGFLNGISVSSPAAFIEDLRANTMTTTAFIKRKLGISTQLQVNGPEDAKYILKIDRDGLRPGETKFQREFGAANKLNPYVVLTSGSHKLSPIPKAGDGGQTLHFSGKTDVTSACFPGGVQWKRGGTGGRLDADDFAVVRQGLERAEDHMSQNSLLRQFVSLSLTRSGCWLIWRSRGRAHGDGSLPPKLVEETHIAALPFNDAVEIFSLLTKQAVLDPMCFYLDPEDARHVLAFTRSVCSQPWLCRIVLTGASTCRVYAITLPQWGDGVFVVSNDVKHFAVKVVQDSGAFEREASVVQHMWTHMEGLLPKNKFNVPLGTPAPAGQRMFGHGPELQPPTAREFYAIGLQRAGQKDPLYSRFWDEAVYVLKQACETGLRLRGGVHYWDKEEEEGEELDPGSGIRGKWWNTLDMDAPATGGVIVMRCARYKQSSLEHMRWDSVVVSRSVTMWLYALHSAGILHCDLRHTNVMAFDSDLILRYEWEWSDKRQAPLAEVKWQIIDLSLAVVLGKDGYRPALPSSSAAASAAADDASRSENDDAEPLCDDQGDEPASKRRKPNQSSGSSSSSSGALVSNIWIQRDQGQHACAGYDVRQAGLQTNDQFIRVQADKTTDLHMLNSFQTYLMIPPLGECL